MRTNRWKRLSLALFIAALLGVVQSLATQIKMGHFNSGSSGNYRARPLGEFASVLDNYASGFSTDGIWFGTFCIEKNESFNTRDIYDVGLNNGSVAGGRSGAVNGKDVISVGTAWLYEHFALGTLSDFGFDYGNRNHAKYLQNTIWYLEGEINNSPTSRIASRTYGSYLDLAMSLDDYSADYLGNSVQVMNLTSRNGRRRHQDQLVYTGSGHNITESGATFALLFVGLAGLLALKRRFERSRD